MPRDAQHGQAIDDNVDVKVVQQTNGQPPSMDPPIDASSRRSFTLRIFIFLLTILPWYLYRAHYRLPEPRGPM